MRRHCASSDSCREIQTSAVLRQSGWKATRNDQLTSLHALDVYMQGWVEGKKGGQERGELSMQASFSFCALSTHPSRKSFNQPCPSFSSFRPSFPAASPFELPCLHPFISPIPPRLAPSFPSFRVQPPRPRSYRLSAGPAPAVSAESSRLPSRTPSREPPGDAARRS